MAAVIRPFIKMRTVVLKHDDHRIPVALISDDLAFIRSLKRIVRSHPRFNWLASVSDSRAARDLVLKRGQVLVVLDLESPRVRVPADILSLKYLNPQITVLATGFPEARLPIGILIHHTDGFVDKAGTSALILVQLLEAAEGGCPLSQNVKKRLLEYTPHYVPPPGVDHPLTVRETEIVELVCRGISDAAIASMLKISLLTVRVHMRHIHEKLRVHSRAELQIQLLRAASEAA